MRKAFQPKYLLYLTFVFCCFSIASWGQQPVITKYFDSTWNKTSMDSAFFYTELVKENGNYACTSFWMKSKKLNCRSSYADTFFAKPTGVLLRYYESGQMQDSTYFYESGEIKNTYHYYDNGKLWVHYTYNLKTRKDVTEAYDAVGNKLEDFVFSKEAYFQEDASEWLTYLSEHVNNNIPVKNGAPVGKYQVVIKFIVGKNGKPVDAVAETSHGFGMEEEIIRVIKKSPKWTPAISMGKTVNAYRRQPITFIVEKR